MSIRHSLTALALAAAGFAAHAAPVPVFVYPNPATFGVSYGDFYSFSMPILSSAARGYTINSVNNFGNGDPYYINTANVIQDALVIGTGSGGNQNNQDLGLTGFVQNGYNFPNVQNGTSNFDTNTAVQPGPSGGGAADKPGTWDISLQALRQYLTVGGIQYDLMAYFNNNQKNNNPGDNNLWARAEITLSDLDGGSSPMTLLFNNVSGGNGDYVLSGGPVTLCFNNTGGAGNNATRTQVSCAGPHDSESTYQHNLGQNDVAYGLTSTTLNNILADKSSVFDLMSVRVQFEGLNNGFENLYIGAACVNRNCAGGLDVPEPGSVALVGLALAGLGLVRRRRS